MRFERPGFVEFQARQELPVVSVSFSSIPVSEEELRAGSPRRSLPFLDHVGFDLPPGPLGHAIFAQAAEQSAALAWPIARQGASGAPVACCFETVDQKLWVYPPTGPVIEFSLGEHRNTDAMGRNLRPSNPGSGAPTGTCCQGGRYGA